MRPRDFIQSELAVVGGLLLDNSLGQNIDLLPDDFLNDQYRIIYDATKELISLGQVADIVTVAEYLDRTTARRGWFAIVADIAMNCVSLANTHAYASIVRTEARKRKAVQIAQRLIENVSDGLESVDEAIRGLMSLEVAQKKFERTITEALAEAIDAIEVANAKKGGLVGVTSGLVDIDESTGGFQRSDLYIVAGRPAMGKTAFLLNCMEAVDVPVGLISAEQGAGQIGLRLLAINGRLSAHRMRLAQMDDSEYTRLTATCARLNDRKIWLNDRPAPTIDEVVRQARRWKFNYGIEALYVDYLQRIKGGMKSTVPRHEEVAHVVMTLKELARELDIPVIALAQVSRNVEARPNKRPYMSDIKDSGCVEQEADVVMTLYRDEVYNEDSEDKGICEVAIMKNRHGPTGLIRTVWLPEYIRFEDIGREF